MFNNNDFIIIIMAQNIEKSLRVTIMIEADNAKKLRKMQAKLLNETLGTVTFSKVINDVLRTALK